MSRTVEHTRGLDFGIAIAKDSTVISTAFTHYLGNIYKFKDRLPVPLEKARALKGMQVSVLFVGRIIDARIIEGRSTLIKPTIDSPIDVFIMKEAVPFDLKKVIYYVIQTGEILGQIVY